MGRMDNAFKFVGCEQFGSDELLSQCGGVVRPSVGRALSWGGVGFRGFRVWAAAGG